MKNADEVGFQILAHLPCAIRQDPVLLRKAVLEQIEYSCDAYKRNLTKLTSDGSVLCSVHPKTGLPSSTPARIIRNSEINQIMSHASHRAGGLPKASPR